MNNVCYQFFPSWPYDDALLWMAEAIEHIQADPKKILLACGSHRETVITLGRNKSMNELNPSSVGDVMIRSIERGGGTTAHEPGQLVLYPVLNIIQLGLTIPRLVSLLEDTLVDFLKILGLKGQRSSIGPGIYIDEKKIGFIGLRIKDGVTSHGLSINLKNDGKIFSRIIPCGIPSLCIGSVINFRPLDEPLEQYMELLAEKFIKNLLELVLKAHLRC